VGKTTLALDLAAGLLCLDETPAGRPCRNCGACRRVESGGHPDVHRLAPEGAGQQIRIGQVQALAAELALLPLEGRCRVAVIEHAQRLNDDAQNALLKTLEEPPAGVTIVLCADDPAGLLPTVISRCARVRLGPVAASVVADIVSQRTGVDELRAEALGRLSGGMVGVALELAARPELLLARDRIARTLLDLVAADRRSRLTAAADLLADGGELASGIAPEAAGESGSADGAGAADSGEADVSPAARNRSPRSTPAERRGAVVQVLAIWREVARDLALAARGAAAELRQRELVEELIAVAKQVEPGRMAQFTERLDDLSRAIDAYANPELVLDALLLEWAVAQPVGRTA
jgi:hypothetical protein